MLKKPLPQQTELEMVTLEGLVPKDHLVRKVEAVIDFSFIHDRVAGLYCPDNGRPPLDPTLMFKALGMATAARKVNCSPMPLPTALAIATTRAIRRSAESVRCWPHARRAAMPPA
jgi:hypothetical protein